MTDVPGEADDVPAGGHSTPPTSPSVGRASALLASGTIVSRILGFAKVIVLAAAVGQVGSAAGDAFGVANQLPSSIYALIAGGVLSAVLVPQIVRAASHDDGGQRYINKIVTLGLTVVLALGLLATLAAPLLVRLYAQGSDTGRGFSPDALALATAFAYWCLPQILFYAIYSLVGEVLNARQAFGAFTWAPVINNLVGITGLAMFIVFFGGAEVNDEVAVWDPTRIAVLAGSATLGVATQALVLTTFWRRAGLRFRPDFRWRGIGLRRTGRIAGWTFGVVMVTQVAAVVHSRVATLASGEGASVLTLQSAWLVFMLPHSVITVSIAIAYFTRMSGHAMSRDLTALRADVASALPTIGVFITFASAVLLVVAFPFARIFEDDFGNVIAMGLVIMAFVIGLVPFSTVYVLQRVFYSLEDTRTPFFIEVARVVVFIGAAGVCALLPVEWIGVGIALATSLACVFQTVVTAVVLRRRLGHLGGRMLLRRQLQYLFAATVSAVVGIGIVVALGGIDPARFGQSSPLAAIVTMAAAGSGMAAVYCGLLLLMRNPELSRALDLVGRRLRRR